MKEKLDRLVPWLRKNWNTVAAGASILGIAVGRLVPKVDGSRDFFLFLGLNAIVWTLVELKLDLRQSLDDGMQGSVFGTMRDARPAIIRNMLIELESKNHGSIEIVGGRLRSISELIREFADVAADSNSKTSGLTFKIYCMDPDYLTELSLPGELNPQDQKQRRLHQKSQVIAAMNELSGLQKRTDFTSRNITIELHKYRDDPFIYAYLFGDRSLIWGGYRWNASESELEGPSNPCELVVSSSPRFEMISEWILNRARLYSAGTGGKNGQQ